MNKNDVMIALRDEFNQWEALLSNLNETQITNPRFAENWSLKDVVAHLHAWQQRSIARLEAALHNREPQYPAWVTQFDLDGEGEPDALNAWLYAQTRDLPWSTVHQNWREGFLRFLAFGDAMPESDLLTKDKYAWLEGYALVDVLQSSLEHHQEHAEYLETVLNDPDFRALQ